MLRLSLDSLEFGAERFDRTFVRELRALTVLCRADCTARFRARARPVPAVRGAHASA